jgi:sugar phosphate isomerase/epimerase
MTAPAPFRLSAFGDEFASDLVGQLASLRQHDVRFLELRAAWGTNVVDFSQTESARVHRHLAETGIGVSAVASPVGKVPIDADFETELDRLRRALTIAHRVGGPLVRVFSFLVPDARYREHRDEVVRRLAVFAREAETAEIGLVLENESYTYGDVPERCRDVIEAVGSPALRCAFDPANFVQVGVRPYADAWPVLKPHVAHIHIKDAVAVNRTGCSPYPERVPAQRLQESVRLPGEGRGELLPILRDVLANGYQGFLAIEPHLERRLPDLNGPDRFGAAMAALRGLLEEAQKAIAS